MTPMQSRLARTLLELKLTDIGKLSGVSWRAIHNFEMGKTQLMRANHEALVRTYERMGVEFLEGDGIKRRQD